MSTQALRSLTPAQRNTFIASFLGWTLDAFDYFLVVVVLADVATDLHSNYIVASLAITLTLAMRPLGAFVFGWFADRYGRRLPLMVDVAFYSVIELLTAFSPNITVFIILRAVYGIAMGGEWGLGAALAMETLPPQRRGLFSGILQEGYAVGNLIASAVFALLFVHIGWRWMFVIGTLPALLILYIRSSVPESPAWQAGRAAAPGTRPRFWSIFRANWGLFVYTILLMAAFNFMSHTTQDPYVSAFLKKQLAFSPAVAGGIGSLSAIGAIAGGIVCGALSQRLGRRNIMIACAVLAILFIPLWVFSQGIAALALGGALMQFAVQGAWGIIPAHLNEISPGGIRGTFPGFTYQLGNLIAAPTLTIVAILARNPHWILPAGKANYGAAMAVMAGVVFVLVIVLVAIGRKIVPERRGESLAGETSPAA